MMKRKRIDAKTDYNILADLGLGLTPKELAVKYNVSVSYISKVRTGRKKIDVYIPETIKVANKLAYYQSDIDKLEEYFSTEPLSLETPTVSTLDSLIVQRISELKVLLETRKLLKEK